MVKIKNLSKKVLIVLLSLMFCLSFSMNVSATTNDTRVLSSIKKANNFLIEQVNNPVTGSSSGNDWQVFAVNRTGINNSKLNNFNNSYYNSINDNPSSVLSYPSDYARAIIVLNSMGKDPTDINSVNLISNMLESKDSVCYDASSAVNVLLALDSKNYDTNGLGTTRDDIINYLMSDSCKKNNNGEFTTTYGEDTYVDLDTTYTAITALSKYTNKTGVQSFIDKAVQSMKDNQGSSGAINNYGSPNAPTTAQALVAAISLNKVSEITKEGKSLVDGLLALQATNGGFKYGNDVDLVFSTPQSLYALTAYERSIQGKKSLYDMTSIDVLDFSSIAVNKVVNLKAKPGIKKISLYYSKDNNAVKYEIYRYSSSSKTYKYLASTTKTYYTNSSLKENTTYYYKVRAVGSDSTKGEFSSYTKAKTNIKTPSIAKIKVGKRKATIYYSKVSGASKYSIYKKVSGGKYKKIATTKNTKYTSKKLKKGKKYTYKVKAIRSSSNYSGYSKAKTSGKIK